MSDEANHTLLDWVKNNIKGSLDDIDVSMYDCPSDNIDQRMFRIIIVKTDDPGITLFKGAVRKTKGSKPRSKNANADG